MKASLALALLLAACAPAMQAPKPTSAPHRPFTGSWRGTGTQTNPHESWSIATTIAEGAPGDVVGTISYPSLACGGDLVLRSMSADTLVMTEYITFGRCVDGGTITLTWRSPESLDYAWSAGATNSTASGQLDRAHR